MRRLLVIALLAGAVAMGACFEWDKKLMERCADGSITNCVFVDAPGYDVPRPDASFCFDGWCFEAPRPHGYDYLAVGGTRGDVFVGGKDGLLLHFAGTRWTRADAGVSPVRGIWARNSREVYFVGGENFPSIWDGTAFAPARGDRKRHSFSIGGAGDTVWWGAEGSILRKQGSEDFGNPVSYDGGPIEFVSLAANSATDCIAIGLRNDREFGFVTPCDHIEPQLQDDAGRMFAAWAGNRGELAAGGDSSIFRRFADGGTGFDGVEFAVNAGTFAGPDVITVGPDARAHRTGAGVTPLVEAMGSWPAFTSVWSSGANDIWAAGLGGLLRHWNGQAWQELSNDHFMNSAFGLAVVGSEVIAVGTSGRIVERAGGGVWRRIPIQDPNYDLYDISLLPNGDGFAVGGREIRQRTGGTWGPPLPVSANLRSVFTRSPTEAWAVGAIVLYWDGANWTELDAGLPQGAELRSVRGNATETWAVGAFDDAGFPLFFELSPGDARADTPPADSNAIELNGLWVFDDGGVAAVGTDCSLFRRIDSTWQPRAQCDVPNRGSRLQDVWGPSGDDFWAVGASGLIWHVTTNEVSTALGENVLLEKIRGGDGGMWITGEHGIILHHP